MVSVNLFRFFNLKRREYERKFRGKNKWINRKKLGEEF